ncbi:unnamed protein product, partial [Iphiclides podalirius]
MALKIKVVFFNVILGAAIQTGTQAAIYPGTALLVIVESHKELRCPECRVLVEAKVEDLPPNVLLMRILEGMKNSAPRKLSVVQRTPRSAAHSQVVIPLPTPTALCKALYDFRMSAPDEEGCLAFDKGYDRLRGAKFENYSTQAHRPETAYQNVRAHDHFPVSVGGFNANNASSDSSSSVNTPSVGASSTTTPNTSSDTSTCESAEPSLPGSPDNAERNSAVSTANTVQSQTADASNDNQESETPLSTSMGVLSLNESSTATNTSLNVTLPPSESPKLNASAASSCSQNQNDSQECVSNNDPSRLDAPSSSKMRSGSSGPDSLLNFGLGLQAALSPSHVKDASYLSRSHREHHHREREKRHSLTPSTHLQGNHTPQNRHSAEILATSLLDHAPERDRKRTEREGERRRRRSRSNERSLPAAYIALYPYKPQKPDELELKKGAQPLTYPWSAQVSQSPQQNAQRTEKEKPKEKAKAEKSSISTGVSLMKRLAAMKKCKSPPPVSYSMDNPVFEDGPGPSLVAPHPVHVRFRCIAPYPPNSEYELELKVDDIVVVSRKRGDGWYKGTLQRTGRTGLFPASFVQSCPHE